jgi:hypothetical protein
MNLSQIDIQTKDTDELLKELKSMVNMRNKMGGAMYYNICNDDAHQIANRLVCLGVSFNTVQEILEK